MSETLELQITIGLIEDGTLTRAGVALDLAGRRFEGVGTARRSPGDPSVPEIGEELAASRAFADLSHRLLDAAMEQMETFASPS